MSGAERDGRRHRDAAEAGRERAGGGARARDRILDRVRASLATRSRTEHPGRFEGARAVSPPPDVLEQFEHMFQSSGGACVRVPDLDTAATWLGQACHAGDAITLGAGVPPEAVPSRRRADPEHAAVGISLARGAVAETGTLILDTRDGRKPQLLPPRHFVLVRAETVRGTLVDALTALRPDLPAALGLHSGPSKSADIGQVMVVGVHGPGVVVAVIIGGV